MAKLTLPSTVTTKYAVEDSEVPDIVRVRARTRRFEAVLDELSELTTRIKATPPGPEKDALRARSLVLVDEMVELSTKP